MSRCYRINFDLNLSDEILKGMEMKGKELGLP